MTVNYGFTSTMLACIRGLFVRYTENIPGKKQDRKYVGIYVLFTRQPKNFFVGREGGKI